MAHTSSLKNTFHVESLPNPSFTESQKTQGCGSLGGENPAAFPKAGPIFQQPFLLPESAQTVETLAGMAFRAARKSVPAASKFAGKPFQQGILGSHSLLEFSENPSPLLIENPMFFH